MLTYLRFICAPVWLGLLDPRFRNHVTNRKFSGCGVFFNRWQAEGYLGPISSVFYHLWVRPDYAIQEMLRAKRRSDRAVPK